MKRVIYTVLTFIGMFVVVALARRITKDSVGPGFISMAVNIITIYILFYVPYRVYKSNSESKDVS
jgi:putative effector of murein hydrolase